MTRSAAKEQKRLSARECLAANLTRLRKEKNWSQEELSFEAGLHRTFVAHVERGVRNISLDNIEKLATALHVPCYKLLEIPTTD
jgi:transcriptional regulator with XRE-family HTH domain